MCNTQHLTNEVGKMRGTQCHAWVTNQISHTVYSSRCLMSEFHLGTWGRPWIHVVCSPGPSVHALIDLLLLPPVWPVRHVCCPPVYVVVCLHPVGSTGFPYITCGHYPFVLTDPGLQGSSCFTNVDLIALCTRDLVHHTLVHVLLWSLHSCE